MIEMPTFYNAEKALIGHTKFIVLSRSFLFILSYDFPTANSSRKVSLWRAVATKNIETFIVDLIFFVYAI